MPADWGCPVWDVWEEPGLFHPGAQEAPFPIQPVWDVYIPAPPRALTRLFSSPSSSPHCISNPVGRVSAACSAEVPLISTMNWDSSVSSLVVVVAVEEGGELGARCSEATPSSVTGG